MKISSREGAHQSSERVTSFLFSFFFLLFLLVATNGRGRPAVAIFRAHDWTKSNNSSGNLEWLVAQVGVQVALAREKKRGGRSREADAHSAASRPDTIGRVGCTEKIMAV